MGRSSSKELEKLFQSGELGQADTKDSAQLQRTAWFYLGIYFGRRGRENQRDIKPAMLALRATPQGEEYFELNREFPGSLPVTKNHQGGLSDAEDESDAKIFASPESGKCPVKTIKNYLSHLNPKLDCLFQRPREKARSFNPDEDKVWYYNSPLGVNSLDSMLKLMSSRAGIQPHLTNNCLRATSVTSVRRGTLNQSPATSPTIQSKVITIDLPSTSKRRCRKRSAPSFMGTKPLQLTKKTQRDGSWTYRLQAHPPRQFTHPQRQFSSSIIKWRFPTTCMKTTHMASKGCIAFLPSLTFTTAPMCKFTIILAEAVKLCLVNINRNFFTYSSSENLTNLMYFERRVSYNSFRTTCAGFDSF